MSLVNEMNRPVNEEAYGNSTILNNLACVLLQSGAYREAFETFRDAVDTLQSSARAPDDPSSDSGRGKIMLALRTFRATERLYHNPDDVSVVGFEDGSMGNLIFETAFGESMHVFVTLRPPSEGQRDSDVDSAIMLHNFALCHLALSRRGLLQETEAHKSALYIFRVAFRLLFQKLEELIDPEGYVLDCETPNFENFCGVVTVVLANLVYTLNHQGFERAARDGYLKLREFLQNFVQSDGASILGRVSAAAAA